VPDHKLRSNFTPGSTPWAMRRAQWTALGLTESDLVKPKIAIVNSSAGAAGQYILPSRDLIASDIEVAVEGALLDGMVCLASCDKTTPGQLMAAGRLNIPTIIVACGYQPSGMYRGEAVDFEDIFRFAGHVNAGRMTVDELGEMSRCAVTGPGVCAGMGTANSMHLATEALGMALPGTTPVLALGPKMWDAVAAAGSRIVALVEEDLKPRSVLTKAAFCNAVTAILSVGGSVNCLKHLQAIAVEAWSTAASCWPRYPRRGRRAGRSGSCGRATSSRSTSTRARSRSRSLTWNCLAGGPNFRRSRRRPGAAGCRCTRGASRRWGPEPPWVACHECES
jgi:dihydroxy-acid dehydratase